MSIMSPVTLHPDSSSSPQQLLNACASEMNDATSRLQSTSAEEDRARSRHAHALEHLADVQGAVCQLSRDIATMQAQIDASYSSSFMCFRSIVAAAKASEASFSSTLAPLIDHSETLMSACDAALRQLQVTYVIRSRHSRSFFANLNLKLLLSNQMHYSSTPHRSALQMIAQQPSPWEAAADSVSGVMHVLKTFNRDRQQQQQQQRQHLIDVENARSDRAIRLKVAEACRAIMQRVLLRCVCQFSSSSSSSSFSSSSSSCPSSASSCICSLHSNFEPQMSKLH